MFSIIQMKQKNQTKREIKSNKRMKALDPAGVGSAAISCFSRHWTNFVPPRIGLPIV
jgi:hypothetical protein